VDKSQGHFDMVVNGPFLFEKSSLVFGKWCVNKWLRLTNPNNLRKAMGNYLSIYHSIRGNITITGDKKPPFDPPHHLICMAYPVLAL